MCNFRADERTAGQPQGQPQNDPSCDDAFFFCFKVAGLSLYCLAQGLSQDRTTLPMMGVKPTHVLFAVGVGNEGEMQRTPGRGMTVTAFNSKPVICTSARCGGGKARPVLHFCSGFRLSFTH